MIKQDVSLTVRLRLQSRHPFTQEELKALAVQCIQECCAKVQPGHLEGMMFSEDDERRLNVRFVGVVSPIVADTNK